MTGTVNEAAVESGLSEAGRLLLAQAGIAGVAMAREDALGHHFDACFA